MAVFARQPGYQRKLTAFVDEYCKIYPNVNTYLQSLAARFNYGNGLNYTKSEAQSLKSTDSTSGTSDPNTLSGVYTGASGGFNKEKSAPVLQMYDFIATMDDLDRQCTQLHQQLSVSSADRSILRKSLAASDMRPWGFHVTFPDLYQTTSDGYRVCIGQQLGEELIYDPFKVILEGKRSNKMIYDKKAGPYRKKTEYELAQDEAHLLKYQTLNDLYALTQGLFRCYVTFTHEITSKMITDDTLNNTLEAAEMHYNSTRGVVRSPYYINKFNEAGDAFVASHNSKFKDDIPDSPVRQALYMLQAKDPNLNHYKDNRFMHEFFRDGLPKDDPTIKHMYTYVDKTLAAGGDQEFANKSEQPFDNPGGAIGWRIVWVDPKDKTNRIVKQITAEHINAAMKLLTFHPIYVCPDLAMAFEKSELRRYFSQRLQQLQSNNIAEQQLNFGTFSELGARDPLQYKKLSTADGRISCYPGTTPTFTKGPTGPLEPLNNVYTYDAATGKYIVGREYVQNVNCVKSFSASAFIINKKHREEGKEKSNEFIPVQYNNPGGGSVEFYVRDESVSGDLLKYFYAKSSKGKSHV